MSKYNLIKKAGVAAVVSMLPLSQAVMAEASWGLSGWVNEGITFYDDGVGSDAVVVSDNGTTLGSRLTFSGNADLANTGLTSGFEVILEPQSTTTPLLTNQIDSNAAVAGAQPFDQTNGYDIGVLGSSINVAGAFGKVTVGLQSMPTDNIAVLADPSLTLWSGISPVFRGSGFTVRGVTALGAGTAAGANTTWGAFLSCLGTPGLGIGIDCNGIYRNGVRYDLPAFGPVSIAIGYANDDIYDIAAKYNSQLGRLNAVFHVGYSENSTAHAQTFQLQAGLLDPVTGLFGSVAYQTEEDDDIAGAAGDTDAYYIKAGIKKGWLSIGDTAIYGEYGSYNDQFATAATADAAITGSEVERIGFSVDQYFGSKLILYGKYEQLELEVDGGAAGAYTGAQDLDLFTTGLTFFF